MVQSHAVTDGQAPPPAFADHIETVAPTGAAVTARVSWHDRALSFVEVCLATGLLTQVLVAGAMIAAGVPMRRPDGSLSLLMVAVPTLVDTVVTAVLVVAFLRYRGERPRDVLLGRRPPRGEVVMGVGLVPVVFLTVALLGAVVQALAPWLHDVPDNPLADLMKTPWSALVMGVVAVVGGGVREELQRGFILHRFGQHLGGRTLGLVVFSVMFGLGHAEVQGWDAAVYTGALGLIWGVVFLARGSIVAPMVSHAIFNAIQVAWQLATA